MSKRIHYNGGSTLIKANPEGGGKVRRTKLGALQIAVMNWNSGGSYVAKSWQPSATEVGEKQPAQKKQKSIKLKSDKPKNSKQVKAVRAEALRLKISKAQRRQVRGKIQSWSSD